MSTSQLLEQLAARGITLSLDGERVRFRAPEGALTDELRAAIARSRREIIEGLRSSLPSHAPAGKCSYCDPRTWVDEPPKGGRIRTTCGKCGRFIGYRLADLRPGRN